ncbi:MAG: diguanylate cyclase [Pseudomonadales bacterium]
MQALIIDPSSSYRQLLSSVLGNYGFDTVEVTGVIEALEQLQQHLFNLICMSVELTDGDSQELCSRVRAMDNNHHTSILLLTSNYTRTLFEDSLAIGFTEVFRKQDFQAFNHYLGNFSQEVLAQKKAGGHILYIEDNLAVAQATSTLLTVAGHTLNHFTTAEQAIESFATRHYDLVLTDMLLAGELSGSAVVRAIRHHVDEEKRDVPIVAISGFSDAARRIELFRAGINDYVQKPVLDEELLARVNNLVHIRHLLKQLKIQQQRFQTMAMSDQLTGLYNRHFMMEALPKRISQARRRGYPLSLMMIDVDHFKQVNDRYGHHIGDEVLVAVATLLRNTLREEDVLARYGGEEFICLMDHCDLQTASQKAETLKKQLSALMPQEIVITASFGVTSLHRDKDDFSSLCTRADGAMYQAKDAGRNCVVAIA